MKWHSSALALAIVLAGVACSNCCCLYYLPHQDQWYNKSFEAAPNMTIGFMVWNMGAEPVTILDSDSDKINVSIRYVISPNYWLAENDSRTILYINLDGSDVYPGYDSETIVYLPQGNNFTVWISGAEYPGRESPVVSRYSGNNFTLWVRDANHSVYYDLHPAPDMQVINSYEKWGNIA
jgi:hypothetical protein